jgi:integrase
LVDYYLESVRGRVKPITLDGYQRLLSTLLSRLGPAHSLFFNQYEIDEYCKLRQIEGAGRTIIKELNALRYALDEFHLPIEWRVPRHLSRLPKRESHVPTAAEYRKLMQSLPPTASLAASMAVFAGLRDSEVPRIGWDAYKPAESLLCVPAAIRKTNVGNVVPVVENLRGRFDAALSSPHSNGTIIPDSPSVIRAELQKASRHAGIKPWSGLQPARRLLVTLAEDAGYGSDQISLVTGHARTSMASRYTSTQGRLELKRRILEDVEARLVA